MLRRLLSNMAWLAILLLVAATHLWLRTLLPSPWFNLNLALALLIYLAIKDKRPRILYGWAILLGWIEELFLTTPFGLYLSSLVFNLWLLTWCLLNIFTNRSIWLMSAISMVFVFLHRIFFMILAGIFSADQIQWWLDKTFWQQTGWEILLTTTGLAIIRFVAEANWKKVRIKL